MRVRIPIVCGTVLLAGSMFAQQPQSPVFPNQQTPAQVQQQQQMQNDDPNQDTGSTGISGPEMRDRAFIRDLYSGGLAEIQLAKLALAKSSNDEVKQFAQMMIDEHSSINQQLEPVAQTMGVSLVKNPSKADIAEYNKLRDMSGSGFDKEYAVYMVVGHRAVQHAARVEVVVVTQDALKQQLDIDIPMIRKHLQAATKLANDVGAAVPARAPRP